MRDSITFKGKAAQEAFEALTIKKLPQIDIKVWEQCAGALAKDVQFLLGEIQAVKNTGEDGVYTATSIMMELFRRYPDGYSEALDHFKKLKK
jgi:hypothetical protein